MKRTLLAAVASLLVAAGAHAATLKTDDFAYGAGAGVLTTVSGGAWVAHSSAGTNPVQYVTSGLSMPGYVFGGTGGAATISASGSEDVNTAFTNQTGDIYASVLVNVSTGSTGAYFVHFKDATTGFRCRVYAQDSTGSLRFGLAASTEAAVYSPTPFSYGTTYLMVLKYNPTSGMAALHVLSGVPASEPGSPLLTAGPVTIAGQEGFAIRQSAGGPAATIDGLRVGTTWAETVPVELSGFAAD